MRRSPSLLGCLPFLVWATLFGDVSLGVRGDGSGSAMDSNQAGFFTASGRAGRTLRQLANAATAPERPSPRRAKPVPSPRKWLATAKLAASPKRSPCPKGKRCPSPKRSPTKSPCPKGKRCPSPKRSPTKSPCPKGKRCPSPKRSPTKSPCPKGKRCPSPNRSPQPSPKPIRPPPSPPRPPPPAASPIPPPPARSPFPPLPPPSSPTPTPIGAPPAGTPPDTLYLCKRFWVADQTGTYNYFKSNFTAAFANLAAIAATTTARSNLTFGLARSNYLSRPSSTVPIIGLNVVNMTFQIPIARDAVIIPRLAAMETWLADNMRAGALSPNLPNLVAVADDTSTYIKEQSNGACIDPATLPPTDINLTYLAATATTNYVRLVANLEAVLTPAYTAVGLNSEQWVTYEERLELDENPTVAWVQAMVPAGLRPPQKADLSWAIQAGLSFDNTLNDERFNRFYPLQPPPHA